MKRVPIHTPSAPERERCGQPSAVEQSAGSDHRNLPVDRVDHLRHEGHGGDLTGVPPGLGALRDDEVTSGRDRGDRVADLAAHRPDQDVVAVQEIDRLAGNAEAGHEHAGPALDHVVDLVLDLAGQRGEQVDPERLGGERPRLGHLFDHLVGSHRRRPERAEAARLAHRGREAVIGDTAHAGEHHGVFDVE